MRQTVRIGQGVNVPFGVGFFKNQELLTTGGANDVRVVIAIEVGCVQKHHLFPLPTQQLLLPRGRFSDRCRAGIFQPTHAPVGTPPIGVNQVGITIAIHVQRLQRHNPAGGAEFHILEPACVTSQ